MKKLFFTLIISLSVLSLHAQNTVEHLQNLNDITKILVDKDKSVWAGNTAGYILHFTNEGKLIEQFFLEEGNVTGLIHSQEGLLFATTYSHFYAFKGGKWIESTFVERPLIEKIISECKVNQTNIVWLKDYYGSLCRFFNNEWKCYDSDVTENMTILFEDNSGNQWFKKSGNLYKFINESFELVYKVPAEFGEIKNETCTTDSKGNNWFGTDKGVIKNNNNEWKFYSKSDSLEFGSILNIFEDKKGIVWAVGTKGSFLYSDSTWKMTSWVNWNQKFIDSKGKVWMYGNKAYIMVYDGTQWEQSTIPDSIAKITKVHSMSQIDDTYYFGTDKGLIQYDGSKWQNYNFSEESYKNMVFNLFTDNDSNLWVYTIGSIFKKKIKDKEFIKQDDSFFPTKQTSNGLIWMIDDVKCLAFDPKNNKYTKVVERPIRQSVIKDNKNNLYLDYLGIYKLENREWTKIQESKSTNKKIYDIFIDSKSNIWVAHWSGLDKFDDIKKEWQYDIQKSISKDCYETFQIIEDGEKNIWISTGIGLVKYNGVNWEFVNKGKADFGDFDFKNYSPRRLFVDKKNNLMCLSESNGLCKLEKNLWKADTTQRKQLGYFSGNIAQDNLNIFLSSKKGLVKFDGKKATYFRHENSLPNNNVTALFIDSKERMWVGTSFEYLLADLHSVSKNIWTKHNNSKTYFSEIYNFFEDSKGNILVGNQASGISKFNGVNWQDVNTNGTTASKVYCFLEDSKKNIWVGHLAGLSKFDGQKWTLVNQLMKSKDFATDNMVIAQLGVFPIIEDRNGDIWAGTEGGLIKKDKQGLKIFNTKNSKIPTNKIHNLFLDKDGSILLYSEQELYVFNEKEVKLMETPPYRISALGQDKLNNTFLITTEGVIYQLSNNQWDRVSKLGIDGQSISSFVITPSFFWIATNNNGIFKIKR